jgi:hypothetical protein
MLDVADRIDDGTRCPAAAAEQIGNSHRIGVKELAENHALALLAKHSIIPLDRVVDNDADVARPARPPRRLLRAAWRQELPRGHRRKDAAKAVSRIKLSLARRSADIC